VIPSDRAVSSTSTAREHVTGNVEGTGTIEGIHAARNSIELTCGCALAAAVLNWGIAWRSMAAASRCQIARSRGKAKLAQFDLLQETWERNKPAIRQNWIMVNLERPLRADGRLGGHS